MKPRKVLVTGAAGFIGYHVSKTLLKSGYEVVGLDNLSDYYDVELKKARLSHILDQDHFRFLKQDVSEAAKMDRLFRMIAAACRKSRRQKRRKTVLRMKTASRPPPSLEPSKTDQESSTYGYA